LPKRTDTVSFGFKEDDELLMGQLDDITDAQLQSWIGVTEATIEAEMKYVKVLVEEKGLPKDFAGRVGVAQPCEGAAHGAERGDGPKSPTDGGRYDRNARR
jgi:hypothetical protein